MKIEQSDIQDIIGAIASSPVIGTNHTRQMNALMRHFCAAGLTVEQCADRQHLNKAVSTVRAFARKLNLSFPDYVPRHLRPKKEKKARAK